MIPHDEPSGPGTEADDPDSSATDSSSFIARLESQRPKSEKYRLVDEIARGGMGIIQKVWDADLQRYLAKKVILSRAEPGDVAPKLLGRFLEEAQISGQLEHPGIVPVHEVGVDSEGHVFFTMQLVKGRELSEIFELVDRGREGWSTTRTLGVILKVCEAMAYAHDKGVIHRDLKPANVMVGRFGEVYVMDWGLAHVLSSKAGKKAHRSSTTMLKLDYAREQAASAAGDSMRTMDGDVIGTPAFMSPQQARGRTEDLDVRADIYSVGAILYRLLAGQAPYVMPAVERSAIDVLRDLLAGPPTPIAELRPDVPGELTAICEKAMARELKERYPNMQALAEDLRAFLENRVVQAFETGAVAELRKWVSRNKGLATAIVAAVVLALVGLGGVVFVEARGRRAADAQRAIALTNELQAKANEAVANENADRARRERANVLRLSAFQKLEDLQAEAQRLWPALPERLPEYESWMARAERLVAGLEPDAQGEDLGHYEQLSQLRSRALPADPALDTQHPRYAELLSMRAELRAFERARAVSRGGVPATPFILEPERARRSADELNRLAWPLVDPDRTEFGRESEGLALARLALARASGVTERAQVGDSVAWALFACGRDEEALEASRSALALVGPQERPVFEAYLERLEHAIEARAGEPGERRVAALEDSIGQLEDRIVDDRPWRFSDDDDRWWHAQLAKLVAEIEAFADRETGLVHGVSTRWGWGVARRLEFARSVEERTLTGDAARETWERVIAEIGDPARSPRYRGLELRPQLGLLPLGRDPASGLFEFAHVMSGEVPARDANGELVLDEASCLVLVLLPGGRFSMGSQTGDPAGEGYSADAEDIERPAHAVELEPFLIAKHEMTQGQWLRTRGENPSRYHAGIGLLGRTIDLRHPVERLSWEECDAWLARMDLALPTEAQWEYAARAGTTTPWWTGDARESLLGKTNIADQSATRVGANWTSIADWPELDDGWPVHAPVATFAANAFGLFDVHGNVREWCREPRIPYDQPVARGDGERTGPGEANRVFRGGGFSSAASRSRSAYRGVYTPDLRFNDLGVRPMRPLR